MAEAQSRSLAVCWQFVYHDDTFWYILYTYVNRVLYYNILYYIVYYCVYIYIDLQYLIIPCYNVLSWFLLILDIAWAWIHCFLSFRVYLLTLLFHAVSLCASICHPCLRQRPVNLLCVEPYASPTLCKKPCLQENIALDWLWGPSFCAIHRIRWIGAIILHVSLMRICWFMVATAACASTIITPATINNTKPDLCLQYSVQCLWNDR